MEAHLPLSLPGSNLQEKHRHLNTLVHKAYEKNVSFQDILLQPESSPIDRIFKIDLASKYRNVEYIIENLKNDDMLYVSRALKCYWILESQYCDIINPVYLENTLYPTMIQPAVNKMKHVIQLHLKDKERCEDFYNYYKANWDEAFSFFWHCSIEFITSEFPNVIDKLSHKQLKIVSEVYPAICKLYFEILPNNKTALKKYVKDAQNYFNCIKSVFKYDGNVFLDIVEKYYDTRSFVAFGPSITDYIMKNYRNRFEAKSELYANSILHMKTLAANMTIDQAKEFVLKLASAEYLDHWFTYKKVEPLIKRLKIEERSAFKKKVFVDKTTDCKVKDWPYPTPKALVLDDDEVEHAHVFADIEHDSYEYGYRPQMDEQMFQRCVYRHNAKVCYENSPLDQLYNQYRFISFEQTFFELSKNLLSESRIEGRLNMMLVLVSKSGGVPNQVEKFMKLMVERHRNEPTTLRAAVVRSLVKRGAAWRLPENVWSLILQFGVDVGLDGADTDPVCREGLHTVILRHILADTPVSPTLLSGFLRQFSTLSEYKLNIEEKNLVAKRLPQLILSSDANALLGTIVEYKINIKDVPNAEDALLEAAKANPALVARLYRAKILRRELFHETFALKQNNDAYINALRHDLTPLENGNSFAELVKKERPNHNRFLKSLYVYFGESGGLAEKHRIALEDAFLSTPKQWFARSLSALLTNEELLKRIYEFESERPQSKSQLLMCTGLRANAHLSKPAVDVDALEWKWIGAKAVANKALICRKNDRERYIRKLLEWRRTARMAVRLSYKTPSFVDTFIAFCTLRPLAAVKVGFTLYLSKDNIELPIWDAMKTVIQYKDISQKKRLLDEFYYPIKSISKNVKADYWVQVFNIFSKIDHKQAMPILCRLENLLSDVDQKFVRPVVEKFIETIVFEFPSSIEFDSSDMIDKKCLYVRVVAKHLLLCKTEDEQKEVIKKVCEPFFDALEDLSKTPETKKHLITLLDDLMFSLKYSKVFLSDQYVNCLPVFEVVLKRMHKLLPVDSYFAKYVEIHLTMLFYKSINQTKKHKPGIFDYAKKRKEAIEIVGRIFGNYIGHEMKELVNKYFKSVVDLYKVPLDEYFSQYFYGTRSRNVLVAFVIKGLLEVGTSEAYILAEYVFQKEQRLLSEPHLKEISNDLKECKNKEVKVFLYADVNAVQET
ncbi:uncharacterized protein [Maniola hyperantus]|uniref:uncharacterized protein n=1 Tax=Aphantopus hyperantus TaxID=2795564 RepID=UPI0015697253|nr:uncharacterized protein LOC117993952 [Maniola hyperantus]